MGLKKCDVLEIIDKKIEELRKDNEKKPAIVIQQHNNGGIYWLTDLKFEIEKR